MRSRPRYELRVLLILWNVCLAVFSIVGAIRSFPEFYNALSERGVVYSVCDGSYAYGITGFWAFMFIMSKVPELIDTLFIILRKQKLIFLHWYHHTTVLCYCWYSYSDFTATGRWFMNMNYIVHGLMYSYYAFKAMRIRVPVFISQLITSLQIIQMIGGCYVNWVAYQTKFYAPHVECQVTKENIYASCVMYMSYFALFFNFFLRAYVIRSGSAKNSAKKIN
jgi:elongation of very long chain fatty acids protein 6